MAEVDSLSNKVYVVLSTILGTEDEIDMRRKLMDLRRDVDSVTANKKYYEELIFSGSGSEGFRRCASDYDLMCVRRGIRAIFSSNQYLSGNSLQTILLAETDETKPGFALLRLTCKPSSDQQLVNSLYSYGSGHYICSNLWIKYGHAKKTSYFREHGPCMSGNYSGIETDISECIKSDYFPQAAMECFLRLFRTKKMTLDSLKHILDNGCHFVAIGSKRPVHELLEWRISFSSAEKTIIYSFNHTQFLCYGLLKIFLKEAINTHTDSRGMICSYFMKTAVFWTSFRILDSTVQWIPENLLFCFWKCLQLLLDWVVNDYCPNFFIPENNMFADKFTRRQRFCLQEHLRCLYDQGYRCIFNCSTISDQLKEKQLELPPLAKKFRVILCMINELRLSLPAFPSDEKSLRILEYLHHLISDNPHKMNCAVVWKYIILTQLAMTTGINCICNEHTTNIVYYRQSKATLNTIKSCRFDATSYLLRSAEFLYRTFKFSDALKITRKARNILQHQKNTIMFYPWIADKRLYVSKGEDTRPVLEVIRKFAVFPVITLAETCVPQLILEYQSNWMEYSLNVIGIPPIVWTYFLDYLCNYRLGRLDIATFLLPEFFTLLASDKGRYIISADRAISWEILGICQEMSGDHLAAFRSYSMALQQEWCPVRIAALIRILNIIRIQSKK